MNVNLGSTSAPAKFFDRLSQVMIGGVGLILLIGGGWMMNSHGWDKTTGTVVGQCRTEVTRSVEGNRHYQYCVVTWQANGNSHTGEFNLGTTSVSAGQSVALRVKGDRATTDTPGWFPFVLAEGGLGLLVLTTVRGVRRRRWLPLRAQQQSLDPALPACPRYPAKDF